MTLPTTLAELDHWQWEWRLVEDLLARVERAERDILTALRCPHDLPAIYAILDSPKKPWPRRMTKRDQQRARYAMHALAHVAETRRHVALGVENARLAARAALLAGLFAGDAALQVALAAQADQMPRKGGHARGKQIAQRATAHDATIKKYLRRWEASDEELQDLYRSVATYIQTETGLPRRTIERRLKVIRERKSRQ